VRATVEENRLWLDLTAVSKEQCIAHSIYSNSTEYFVHVKIMTFFTVASYKIMKLSP